MTQSAKRIIRTHDYKDVNGNLLYQVVRYEPKEFKYRHSDGQGGWIWNLHGIEPVLYHLDEIIISKLYGETVYVCEGERDADNAFIYFGSTGTCNPFGAGKWKESYNEVLTDCNVTIIPDNDLPGKQHALLVFTNLKNRAKSITIFQVPPQYKDFTEYLDGRAYSMSNPDGMNVSTASTEDVAKMLGIEKENPGQDSIQDNINIPIFNRHQNAENNRKTFQNRDKPMTDSFQNADNRKRPNYSVSFDNVLRDAGKMSRRDIALSIGLQHTSDTFRQIVKRRLDDGLIRPWHGRHDILEWVNRDYKVLTLTDYRKQANLSITLPLNLNKYLNVPAGSVIGVAGYTSAGKTSFLLEICELNVNSQDLPVYYWFNEMSEDRMLLRLEDYPLLVKELGNRFKAVKQTDFEFYDVIEPDAINVIDYLDLDGEGENQQVYMIGAVIKKLQRKLGKGIVIFALQKQKEKDMGYGGVYSAKLSNLYLSLDTVSQGDISMLGKCKIVKAKDWGDVNPVGLYCNYYTGGKHGKIMSDNLWRRDKSNE